MDLTTAFVSSVLFPLQEAMKKHDSVAVRRRLDASQWWGADRLQALQLDRLRALLGNIGENVPYYRQLFADLQFDPASITRLDDLQRLPFLTKALIKANTEAMKHAEARDLARFNTGGSSGEPLIFFIGKERVSHDVAAKWRATRWWDVDIGDREIVVWGSPIELGTQDRLRGLRDALMRTELMPAFEMNEKNLDRFVARIRERRPKMLFGYPSAISHIAAHAQKKGVALDQLGVKVVFCTSERLYDHQRAAITAAFGCPVANGYGGRDAGFIAHECPAGGMHITAEDIIVEIVDAEGRPVPVGESGEIVTTHLATADFPFVRYRTGDIGSLSADACSCGRGLPLLKAIEGRSTDFVLAADGTLMHGLALIYTLRDQPGVREFKVIQESLLHTRVLLVTEPPFSAREEAAIVAGLKQRLGSAVDIDIEHVAHIPAEKSGKFRYIVSHALPKV